MHLKCKYVFAIQIHDIEYDKYFVNTKIAKSILLITYVS